MPFDYLDQASPSTSSGNSKFEYLDQPSPETQAVKPPEWKPPDLGKLGDQAANVVMGGLETIDAPFQVAGEAIRGAGENEPLRLATAANPQGFRAPSILQRMIPGLRTPEPPADPFQKAYQGLEGIANLPRGVQAASDVVTGRPDVAAQIGGAGIALGLMPPKMGAGQEAAALPEAESGLATKRVPALTREVPPDVAPKVKTPAPDVVPMGGGVGGKSASLEAAEDFAKNPPLTATPSMEAIEDVARNPPLPGTPPIAKSPMEQVQEALTKQFGPQVANKANDLGSYIHRTVKGALSDIEPANLADFAQEKSQMMAVKAAGGGPLFATQGLRAGKTPTQINDELRAIGQYMIDNDIVRPELGNKMMLKTQQDLLDKAGAQLGAIRKVATDLHTPENYADTMLQHLDGQLGAEYAEGMPGAGEYNTALAIVQKAEPTYQGMADAATKLNKLANKANKNYQAHTPFTDVANHLSQFNNEGIKTVVGPDVAHTYEQSLREFGVNKKIQNMLGRKVGQELHRTGPGSMTRAFYQKIMDEVGYKGGAKVLNKMAGNIKAKPEMAHSLPELFKSFINEVEEIMPEAESKAFGGIVGEMDAYLTPKYGGTA